MATETQAGAASSDSSEVRVRDLAKTILRRHVDTRCQGLVRLPSERRLSADLEVSRHLVSNALGLLEEEGLVTRLPRGGSFVVPTAVEKMDSTEPGLRCISVLQTPGLMQESLQWLLHDYFIGYTEALDHHDHKLRFVRCPSDIAGPALESLLWHRAPLKKQGCVLVNLDSSSVLEWLTDNGVPFVVQYTCQYDTSGLPEHHKVYVNKAGGAFAALKHLMDLGHRRIGHVGGLRPAPGGQAVYEGFQAGLRCAGLAPDPEAVLEFHSEKPIHDVQPIVDFLARPDRPTALFAANDSIALCVMEAAKAVGLSVPDDLSVVGMNDQEDAARSVPPLTTVAIPRRRLARTAVELLLAAEEERADHWETRILECQLKVRGTTAPPPS